MGPFIVQQAYPNGSVDLLNPNDNRVIKVNGQRVKPYVVQTVAAVAEKLDLTFGRFCLRCNFQTVRNLQKGTTEMSSGGPKMVEMSNGVA